MRSIGYNYDASGRMSGTGNAVSGGPPPFWPGAPWAVSPIREVSSTPSGLAVSPPVRGRTIRLVNVAKPWSGCLAHLSGPLGSEGYYLRRSLYGCGRRLGPWCYVSWCRGSDSLFVTLYLAPLSPVSTLVDCLSSGHPWQETSFPFTKRRSHWDMLGVWHNSPFGATSDFWVVNWDAGTFLDSLDSVTFRELGNSARGELERIRESI
ncbi:hypothetical protein EDB86DRAFT_2829456 [Lactarius hatsudake]|nr:hypothetical protein EDB86DRAFT_2829456 [Lactarius hatsudake]